MRNTSAYASSHSHPLSPNLRHSAVALGWEPVELPALLAGATASCWRSLAVQHREILLQRLVHDRSYDEIGRRMGISTVSVRYRISRARESLRSRINEVCPAFAAIAA